MLFDSFSGPKPVLLAEFGSSPGSRCKKRQRSDMVQQSVLKRALVKKHFGWKEASGGGVAEGAGEVGWAMDVKQKNFSVLPRLP